MICYLESLLTLALIETRLQNCPACNNNIACVRLLRNYMQSTYNVGDT